MKNIKVLRKCPSCGAPNSSGQFVCEFCGTYLAEESFSADSSDDYNQEIDTARDLSKVDRKEKGAANNNVNNSNPFWIKMRSWKTFFPVWSIICCIIGAFPFLVGNIGFDLFTTFVLIFIPGIIIYGGWKANKFKPVRWIFWLFVLLVIDLLLFLWLMIKFPDMPVETGLIVFTGIYVLGVLFHRNYKKQFDKL